MPRSEAEANLWRMIIAVIVTLKKMLRPRQSASSEYIYVQIKRRFWTDCSIFYIASISSRPGQSGRADGYILEGKELEFYMRKIKSKKAK